MTRGPPKGERFKEAKENAVARLPSGEFLIQQIGDEVILFHEHTQEQVCRFPVGNGDRIAVGMRMIYRSDLDEADKSFASFWAGYFYAFACYPETGTPPQWAREGWPAEEATAPPSALVVDEGQLDQVVQDLDDGDAAFGSLSIETDDGIVAL